MTIYRRKGSKTYYMNMTTKGGDRVRRSTGTKIRVKAQELHDRIKNESWDVANLDKKPPRTWSEAVVRYSIEKSNKKSYETIMLHIRKLDKYFKDKYLHEITTNLIDEMILSRRCEFYQRHPNGKDFKTKDKTINNMLSDLRALFNRAKENWEWIDDIPKINFIELDSAQTNIIWLEKCDAKKILEELPSHLQIMMKFSLATGLRQSNVTGLTWSQININKKNAWVDPIQSKNSKAIQVPLNDDALRMLLSQKGRHPVYVFTYNGNPIKKANTAAWRKALDRAGIRAYEPSKSEGEKVCAKYPMKKPFEYKYPTFRWHDLRHTWASWHVQAGTPLAVLQALGGWKSFSMVLHYAHLGDSHISHHANNISIDDDE